MPNAFRNTRIGDPLATAEIHSSTAVKSTFEALHRGVSAPFVDLSRSVGDAEDSGQ
jgi:hypothetical protein